MYFAGALRHDNIENDKVMINAIGYTAQRADPLNPNID